MAFLTGFFAAQRPRRLGIAPPTGVQPLPRTSKEGTLLAASASQLMATIGESGVKVGYQSHHFGVV